MLSRRPLLPTSGLLARFEPWLEYDNVVVLRAPGGERVDDEPPHIRVVEERGLAEIARTYEAAGRRANLDRIGRRLATGLRFYRLGDGAPVVASMWLVVRGRRFIDEIGYQADVPDGSVWLRDVFVAPAGRGKRLFAAMLSQVIRRFYPATQHVYSDTSRSNAASLRAHAACGFREVGSMRVLHVAGTWMIRSPPCPAVRVAHGFELGRRGLWTGARYRRYVADHLA